MAETKKTYRVYINQDAAYFETEAGDRTGVKKPDLYVGNYFIFQADVKNSDGTAFEFPADAIFFAALNGDLGSDDPDEAATAPEDFNQAAQWSEIDLVNGKISWEMNTLSDAISTLIGSKTSTKIWLELWFKEPDGNYSKILHERLTIYNSGSDFIPVEVPELTYATTDDLTAKADKPSRVADFAALPASPSDLDSVYVTSVSAEVIYDAADAAWYYRGTSVEFTAADEA